MGNRSFGLVDAKLAEADFFLDKIREAGFDYISVRFYFSAFVSSARSITFALQAVMKGIEEYDHWYEGWRTSLKNDPTCRFFLAARTENQKIGTNHVGGGSFSRSDEGHDVIKHYWHSSIKDAPEDDVVASCNYYLVQLATIVGDCYLKFGRTIDPAEYYTLENMVRLGLVLEDFEEQVGMPRGWTFVPGCTDEERLGAVRREVAGSEIAPILYKYLGPDWSSKR